MGRDIHFDLEVRHDRYPHLKRDYEAWEHIVEWSPDRCYALFNFFENGEPITHFDRYYEYQNRGRYNVSVLSYKEFMKKVGKRPSKKVREEGDIDKSLKVTKKWLFEDDGNYRPYREITKLMVKLYGPENVRIIVSFDC